jgi:hypothetical protein
MIIPSIPRIRTRAENMAFVNEQMASAAADPLMRAAVGLSPLRGRDARLAALRRANDKRREAAKRRREEAGIELTSSGRRSRAKYTPEERTDRRRNTLAVSMATRRFAPVGDIVSMDVEESAPRRQISPTVRESRRRTGMLARDLRRAFSGMSLSNAERRPGELIRRSTPPLFPSSRAAVYTAGSSAVVGNSMRAELYRAFFGSSRRGDSMKAWVNVSAEFVHGGDSSTTTGCLNHHGIFQPRGHHPRRGRHRGFHRCGGIRLSESRLVLHRCTLGAANEVDQGRASVDQWLSCEDRAGSRRPAVSIQQLARWTH